MKKILAPSFKSLTHLFEPADVVLRSTYASLEGINATIQKGERNFMLDIPAMKTYQDMAADYDDCYGLHKPFILERDKVTIKLPKGTAKVNLNLNGLSAKCELPLLEYGVDHQVKTYFRLILPRNYNNNKDPYNFISSERYETDTRSTGFSGLIRFNARETSLELFNCNEGETHYLMIDSVAPATFANFKESVQATIFSLGFVTGELHRNELFILQSNTPDFEQIEGCYFERMKDTVSSGMEVVSPWLWKVKGYQNIPDSYLDRQSFSNLVTAAMKDHRLLRALQIITEGNAYSFEIRASVYSVALETIKNIIIEEHQEKINPFKNKTFASKLTKQWTEQVTSADEKEFNDKNVIIKRLEQLNQITNKDSFMAAFKVFNFRLNEADKDALNKRNDFLHGRIPFEDEEDSKQQLQFITYKMHYLVSILILKYVGFKGWIRNTPLFLAAVSKHPNLPDEALFVK